MSEQDEQQGANQQRQEQMRQKRMEILQHAVDDPQFRQQLLENPTVALGKENAIGPQLSPEIQHHRRQLMQDVLDRATNDRQFLQQLIQKPIQAMNEAGLGPRLEQLRAELPMQEVKGYGWNWTSWGSWVPGTFALDWTGW